MVLASVVIPAYNSERTIRKTIESVLDQTISDIEVIVINDGSTDSTCEVIKSFTDSRIKLFSFPNKGLAASRNRGLQHAKGQYISFIDADDLWHPLKLEAQIEQLQLYPEASVAYCWNDFIDDYGNLIHSGSRNRHSGYVYEKLLVFNFIENGSNILVKRAILSGEYQFDESLQAAEDWEFTLQLARNQYFVISPAAHVYYRQPAGSMSSNFLKQEQESIKVLQREFAIAPEKCQSLKKISISNLYIYLATKALQEPLSRQKGKCAIRFIRIAYLSNLETIHKRQKLLTIMLAKAIISVFAPRSYTHLKQLLSISK